MKIMAIPTTDQLRLQYNKSEIAQRLHYVMAHHEHKGDKTKLSQCLKTISALGVKLDSQQGEGKWTPL